jgi:hypothetical protein
MKFFTEIRRARVGAQHSKKIRAGSRPETCQARKSAISGARSMD